MDTAFNFWLSVIIVSLVGTLAHFLYDISHQKRILGLFAAVNESTWEHIKIAITPTLLWSLYDGYLYGTNPNYFCAKLLSLLLLTFFIPFIFYSYKHFTKKPVLIVDILTFYIAIVLSQLTLYVVLSTAPVFHFLQYLSCVGLFVFFGCYMTLTLEPLKNVIFKDPITGKYGFKAHRDFFKSLKKKKNRK